MHPALWGAQALLIGCDVRNATKETMEIIGNKEVIAVNQVHSTKGLVLFFLFHQIWAGPLSNYRVALVLLNRSLLPHPVTAQWDDIGIPPNSVVEARDLWEHKTLKEPFVGNLTAYLDSHTCKMYVLKPIS
ncbi:hypothetical protein RHMOL_Rhmol06G0071700 [Rhododendron molle]|uniref:Uncharacterized protein n=1 Tax=Rhododendron molle TaxID=49168 RepID=A0ACC0NAJ0_RHOML|nr:hypothetical protein RHMOL_Rhmol06G0071700 [Rhododendron molle]